jgi:hypothetical protein
VHAADDLDAALAAVEKVVQIPGHLTQVFHQRRCIRVKGSKEQPLVAV